MKLRLKSLLLLSLSLLLIILNGDESVIELDEGSFDEFIENNPSVLVEFFAPWCGHCKSLAPEYESAAQTLSEQNAKTILAKVDATVEKSLAGRFAIRGFPTLKYFEGSADSPTDYNGGRKSGDIVSWVTKRELPAVSDLTSADEIKSFKSRGKVVLVGFFDKDSDEATALASVAEQFRDEVVTGLVSDSTVASSVNAEFNSVVMYRSFMDDEDDGLSYSGDFDSESLSQFIKTERFPLIDQIGPENYQGYVTRGLPIVWIALDPADEDTKKLTIDSLMPYAKDFKGKLSFTWVNSIQFAQHVKSLGISTGGFMIADGNDKFLYKGKINESDKLSQFFDNYNEGSLEKFLKSEDIPKNNNKPVTVLVGKTFNDYVGKNDKDVFVEFYAPWCGHCKRLAPEYEKVGDEFKDNNDIIIAKIDATENDTPEQIQGFPTLIFYPKGETNGVKYDGDRTSDAIVGWIKKRIKTSSTSTDDTVDDTVDTTVDDTRDATADATDDESDNSNDDKTEL